jgi:hypothetical protein
MPSSSPPDDATAGPLSESETDGDDADDGGDWVARLLTLVTAGTVLLQGDLLASIDALVDPVVSTVSVPLAPVTDEAFLTFGVGVAAAALVAFSGVLVAGLIVYRRLPES